MKLIAALVVVVLGVIALGGAGFSGSGAAKASKDRTTWRFDSHGLQWNIKRSVDWPSPGSKFVTTGTYHTWRTEVGSGARTEAHGAWVKHSVITGNPAPQTYTFKGRTRTYVKAGSHLTRYHGRFTIQPDLSVVLTGRGRIVRGAGTQQGARGRFKIEGSTPSGPSVPMRIHSWGRISY